MLSYSKQKNLNNEKGNLLDSPVVVTPPGLEPGLPP